MFEIGNSLREARSRQGIELAEASAATMIRVRYLEALEQERFELLPAGPYRSSFLREYAEFLGLAGDAFVREYEFRVAPPEPEPAALQSGPGVDLLGLFDELTLRRIAAFVATVVVVGVAVWQLGGSGSTERAAPTSPPQTQTRTQTSTTRTAPPAATKPELTKQPVLTLTSARGTCWLSVRVGSATGRVVDEQTLRQGQMVRFGLGKPLWIRLGAPWNVNAAIGVRPVTDALPSRTGDILATAAGLRPAS